MDRLVAAVSEGLLTKAEVGGKMEILRDECSKLEEEYQRASARVVSASDAATEIERICERASDFQMAIKRMNGATARELVRPWIAQAVVDRETDTLTISLTVPDPIILSHRPGRD